MVWWYGIVWHGRCRPTAEALTALVTEMKESENGHDEEPKVAIGMLEEYRNEEHNTSLITKENQDRAILIAEIFTAMIAQSPVEMVVQTILGHKASEETPTVEDLENIKEMMIEGMSKQEISSALTTTTAHADRAGIMLAAQRL